jgi:hypothetical protein
MKLRSCIISSFIPFAWNQNKPSIYYQQALHHFL